MFSVFHVMKSRCTRLVVLAKHNELKQEGSISSNIEKGGNDEPLFAAVHARLLPRACRADGL